MTIMQALKERTREHHNNAEGQEFQRQLAAGELRRDIYIGYLGQLFLIHKRLETRLRQQQASLPGISQVLSDDQLQVPFLQQDLEFFGAKTEGLQPLTATSELLQKIDAAAENSPIALLGFHYVLLGSKHGGKFIAHSLQEKYRLNEGRGATYFDPYGTNFQQIWKSFTADFNAVEMSQADQEAVIQAATDTFLSISRLSEELLDNASVEERTS